MIKILQTENEECEHHEFLFINDFVVENKKRKLLNNEEKQLLKQILSEYHDGKLILKENNSDRIKRRCRDK